jgi:hypothetical protein
MKDRRWFVTPDLLQWKEAQAHGKYDAPFFSFPAYSLWFIPPPPQDINPSNQNTVRSALAWTFNVPERSYRLLQES